MLAGCYTSHSVDGGPVDAARPPPGAYEIPFAPLASGGRSIALNDDALSDRIPIGFSFRFFDETHTELVVSSNGFVTFTDELMGSGCCRGLTIPANDEVDDLVALAWTDLFPPGGGSITHETRGSAPNRVFVLTLTDQSWCCDTNQPRVTSQLALYEGTDFIEVHTTGQSAGHTYTQGVEDAAGRRAFFRPGRVAADYALTRDGVRFVTY